VDDWGSGTGRGSDGIFSLCHCVEIGSEAYPSSYPACTGGSFPGGKVTGL
jgi:hypothetical protein